MAGGAAGAPTGQTTNQGFPAQQPSQASQYSNYGAQPNGAFYAGPMAGAPAYTPQAQQAPVQQPQGGFPSPLYGQQMNQPQYGGGYGQGYGSPFGGMGGGYGYQQPPQYGYGGMGNQFMGGFPGQGYGSPFGGMFGGERGFGRGGFDPRYMDVKPRPAFDQPQPAVQAQPGQTEQDWTRYAANKMYANQEAYDAAKKAFMEGGAQQTQGPAFGGFRGPRRGFGNYGGGIDPRMMRGGFGGFGGYDY